jgi:putative oxidoreductase
VSAISAGLLAVRFVVGLAFVFHGLPKIQSPFNWMNAMGMADAPPGWLQATAAVIEVGGGALLIAGLFTRLAAAALVAQMIAALALVHIPNGDPFVAQGQPSSELAWTYLAVSSLLLVTGPGAWSIDALLAPRGEPWRLPAPDFDLRQPRGI